MLRCLKLAQSVERRENCGMVNGQRLGVAILWSVVLATSILEAQEHLSGEQIRQFLLSAHVVAWRPIGRGITQSWRLTLSDGRVTHDAAFQSVDDQNVGRRLGPGELDITDSYRYNIAAYELADLLGLGHMVPVTVARTWDQTPGALSWWVDDIMFDEQTQLEERRWPDDLEAWGAQIDRMSLFTELVNDTDRHRGNVLYAGDWKLFMVDFTRAFHVSHELQKPYRLLRVDRQLFDRIQRLTTAAVGDVTRPHLSQTEVASVIARRDALVEHFRDRVDMVGEDAVFYEAPSATSPR